MISYIIDNLSHFGDILAIPFFAGLVIYFYNIQDKSIIEYILLWFSISGLILDILYTYLFLSHLNLKAYSIEPYLTNTFKEFNIL